MCTCHIYYWTLRTLPRYSMKKRKTGYSEQTNPHFLQKCKQGTCSSVERLSSRAVSLSSPHFREVSRHLLCPSNLGEYSLVHLLFFQNLHWVFGYGLQCLGPEDISVNILVSENCNFFYCISFADF